MGKHFKRSTHTDDKHHASRVLAIGIEESKFLVVTKNGKTKIPGGGEKIIDAGNFRATGRRELSEETGLGGDLPKEQYKLFFEDRSGSYVTTWFVVLLPNLKDRKQYGDEGEKVGTLPVSTLFDPGVLRKELYHFHADVILNNCVQMTLQHVVRKAKARAKELVAA